MDHSEQVNCKKFKPTKKGDDRQLKLRTLSTSYRTNGRTCEGEKGGKQGRISIKSFSDQYLIRNIFLIENSDYIKKKVLVVDYPYILVTRGINDLMKM